jgi:hypothetical protein
MIRVAWYVLWKELFDGGRPRLTSGRGIEGIWKSASARQEEASSLLGLQPVDLSLLFCHLLLFLAPLL